MSLINTLIKIGQWQSENKDDWDDIIHTPKIEETTKKGVKIAHYIVSLNFDVDQQQIYVAQDNLEEYEEERAKKHRSVKIQGGNNKSFYVCVEAPKSLEQLKKSLFGKEGDDRKGEFMLAIEHYAPALAQSQLYQALHSIDQLYEVFARQYLVQDKKGKLKVARDVLFQGLGLTPTKKVALVYTQLKSKALGITTYTPLYQLEGYEAFIRQRLLGNQAKADNKQASHEKLCYASGLQSQGVAPANFSRGYNFNAMFVQTTKNYAQDFDKKNFGKNYQLSSQNLRYLERASELLLSDYKVKIAEAAHVIVPEFMGNTALNFATTLEKIRHKTNLLFRLTALDSFAEDIQDELDEGEPFWLNFIAYESDGNFFKAIHQITEVSHFYFQQVLSAVEKTAWEMRKWLSSKYRFNFYSIYQLVPVRKGKEKKNVALVLLKEILEGRKINKATLFKSFVQLVLCHRYERYRSYTNVRTFQNFDFAVKEAVFSYLAFFQILKKLNLLNNMDNNSAATTPDDVATNKSADLGQQIEAFFTKMDYNDAQKALFYLGRALNSVAYKQSEQGYKSKPILNKINFNGLRREDIVRLRKDLTEKTLQYKIHKKTEFDLARFTQYFDFNHWQMPQEEAVFFLLSGYSFGTAQHFSEPKQD